jgi:glycosyltransferase involved in cell wall biosynthesis
MGWINELNQLNNNDVLIGCVNSVKKYRKNYFAVADSFTGIIYFFNSDSKLNFFKKLKQKDVFISLGMFHMEFFKALFFLRSDCEIYIMSEPYNNISRTKRYVQKLFSFLIFTKFKKNKIFFLAMGGLPVKRHYYSVGFSRCKFYNFGYFPKLTPNYINKNTKDNQKINFLFVGQLIPRKGIDVLINLLKYLNDKYNDEFFFNIIGDGMLKNELIEYIKDFKTVKFLGLISDVEAVNKYYKEADVLFLPSYFDGWGAVVNEAMAQSCSLLLSEKVYSSQALLIENNNGYVFDPYNFNSLSCKVDNYFSNKNLLQEHSAFSFELYKEWNEKNAAFSFQNLLNGEKNTNVTLLKNI